MENIPVFSVAICVKDFTENSLNVWYVNGCVSCVCACGLHGC